MVNNIEIEFLQPKKEYSVGNPKNIAVPNNNVNDLKKGYVVTEPSVQSNADMLTQSFSPQPTIVVEEQPTIEPIVNEQIIQNTPIGSEPVQISGIPNPGLTSLESTPVNMEINSISNNVPEIPVIDPINNVGINSSYDVPQMPVIEPIENNTNTDVSIENPVINEMPTIEQNSGIDSGFKVSNQPNIFDNPNLNPVVPEIMENNIVQNDNNINQSIEIQSNEQKNDISSLNDDILMAEIAIEENNIKHFEALAENSRKRVELLKRQIKNEKQEDVSLENTASNLFNNNGILDDEKVLGKVPMPNILAA